MRATPAQNALHGPHLHSDPLLSAPQTSSPRLGRDLIANAPDGLDKHLLGVEHCEL